MQRSLKNTHSVRGALNHLFGIRALEPNTSKAFGAMPGLFKLFGAVLDFLEHFRLFLEPSRACLTTVLSNISMFRTAQMLLFRDTGGLRIQKGQDGFQKAKMAFASLKWLLKGQNGFQKAKTVQKVEMASKKQEMLPKGIKNQERPKCQNGFQKAKMASKKAQIAFGTNWIF